MAHRREHHEKSRIRNCQWNCLLGTPCARRPCSVGNLVITQAWSHATPGGAPVAGGYLTIENKGLLPDRLLSGASDAARKIEIHEMAMDKGIMTMRPIEGGLFIEAGKTVKFEPGGRHLMFIGLAAPFREGEQVPVSLAFETAGKVTVPFAVQGIGAHAPDPLTKLELQRPAPPAAAPMVRTRPSSRISATRRRWPISQCPRDAPVRSRSKSSSRTVTSDRSLRPEAYR